MAEAFVRRTVTELSAVIKAGLFDQCLIDGLFRRKGVLGEAPVFLVAVFYQGCQIFFLGGGDRGAERMAVKQFAVYTGCFIVHLVANLRKQGIESFERTHFLSFALVIPAHTALVGKQTLVDSFVELLLFVGLHLLHLTLRHAVFLTFHHLFQYILILLDIVQVVNNFFRIVENGKQYGLFTMCTEGLYIRLYVCMGGEHQFHITVNIALGGIGYGLAHHLILEISRGALLVVMGLDWNNGTGKQQTDIAHNIYRSVNNKPCLTDFVLNVYVRSFKQYQTVLVFGKAYNLKADKTFDNLFTVPDVHCFTGITRDILTVKRKTGCTKKPCQSYGFHYIEGIILLRITRPVHALHTLQTHLHGTPAHTVGIGVAKIGVKGIDNVVIHLPQMVCPMFTCLKLRQRIITDRGQEGEQRTFVLSVSLQGCGQHVGGKGI